MSADDDTPTRRHGERLVRLTVDDLLVIRVALLFAQSRGNNARFLEDAGIVLGKVQEALVEP